eukprot:1760865-Pyramimonas_sp.AAC.1
MLAPVTAGWRQSGYGVRLTDEASNLLVNHWLWADNILLAAASRRELTHMLEDLTRVLHRFGFNWKASSMEFLACGVQ